MIRRALYFIVLFLFFASTSPSAQPGQWTCIGPNPYYLGGFEDYFGDITFTDSMIGYATDAINPRIMKTTDGGSTWHMMNAAVPGTLMQFVDNNTGWISDGYTLAKTSDGAVSWVKQLDTTAIGHLGGYFQKIQFLNQEAGFVTGYHYLSKTNNGGNSWQTITPPATIDSLWSNVFFLNPDTGWVFGFDSIAAKTIDGGITWQRETYGNYPYEDARGVIFFDADNGIVIGVTGDAYKTVDGGNAWNKVTSAIEIPNYGHISTLKFGDKGLVYANDQFGRFIYISADTGKTWKFDTILDSRIFPDKGIYFFSAQKGFMAAMDSIYNGGSSEFIYTTADSGKTWVTQSTQFPAGEAILDYGWISPTHIIACTNNYEGYIESFDAGVNWQLNDSLNILHIQNINSSCYFLIGGDTGVYRYDHGLLDLALSGNIYGDGYQFIFAKSRDSLIVSYCPDFSFFLVLRTVNGGVSWDTIYENNLSPNYGQGEWHTGESNSSPYNNFCRFMTWDTGMIAYTDSNLRSNEFLTLNGGRTWQPVIAPQGTYMDNAKISPSGELFCIRSGPGQGTLWKLDSALNWKILNLYADISGGYPDFGWSSDNILWADYMDSYSSLQYSLNAGNTWTSYPLYIPDGITMFKQLYNGQFVAGGADGELMIYDGSVYNCIMKGQVFYDFNRNGILDGYDLPASGYPVNISPIGTTVFTGPDGGFITASDSGTYILKPAQQFNYRAVPDSLPVGFSGQSGVSAGNNFALQPIDTNLRDLAVHTFEDFESAPGFVHQTWITYSNFGTKPIQPVLSITLDSALEFSSADIPGTQNSNTISWNLPVIYPLQSKEVTVNSKLSLNAQLGQLVTNITSINPIDSDYNPADNTDTTRYYVFGSHDPNFKEVNLKSIVANQTSNQSTLMYTIHFQNTGTDSTHFVFVNDQLPASLNPATLRVIASSSPCEFYMQQGNVAVFKFSALQLPDSSVDAVGSNGFVSFVISPIAENINADTIYNSADVYFDYNPAVTTQFAKTAVLYHSTDIKPVYGDLNVKIYPNPSNNIVHVVSDNEFTAQFFDLWGRQIFTEKSANAKMDFNVGLLASGMYYLRIVEAEKVKGFSVSVVH